MGKIKNKLPTSVRHFVGSFIKNNKANYCGNRFVKIVALKFELSKLPFGVANKFDAQ